MAVLSEAELLASAASIAELQNASGMIPWYPGGHADAWNHVECAMALASCGFLAEAEAAYEWLAATQQREDRRGTGFDGSWYAYYLESGIEDPRRETNMCAYIAVGVWHHYLLTRDRGFLETMWPVVDRAIEFVLRWQQEDGTVLWSVDDDGTPGDHALLTGSSSIHHALRAALAGARLLGLERPEWELAAGRLAHAIVRHPERFAPKDEFAMDWYYPILGGAIVGAAARARIADGWSTYVMEELGVRCVSNRPWVTAAETAECVLALDAVGDKVRAREMLERVQEMRAPDGTYWTGWVLPDRAAFPADERSSYSAAAMVLAAKALDAEGPASGIFRGEGLPVVVALDEPMGCACDVGAGEDYGRGSLIRFTRGA